MERASTMKVALAAVAAVLVLGVPLQGRADGGKHDDGEGHHHKPKLLACDDTLKDEFKPDSLTTVLLVKAFKKGDPLTLSSPPPAGALVAANDVCVVKLLVGPGNPGPAGAPSTSAGIGIEVWLPTPATWNKRIHVIGGGGWAGGVQTSLTQLAGPVHPILLRPRLVRQPSPPSKARSRRAPTPDTPSPAPDRSR